MTTTVNLPIQLVSSCSTLGHFYPIWFRYESEEHEIITVKINDIINTKENHYNGIDEIIYTCSAPLKPQEEKLFTVKYNVSRHKWTLFQLLS